METKNVKTLAKFSSAGLLRGRGKRTVTSSRSARTLSRRGGEKRREEMGREGRGGKRRGEKKRNKKEKRKTL